MDRNCWPTGASSTVSVNHNHPRAGHVLHWWNFCLTFLSLQLALQSDVFVSIEPKKISIMSPTLRTMWSTCSTKSVPHFRKHRKMRWRPACSCSRTSRVSSRATKTRVRERHSRQVRSSSIDRYLDPTLCQHRNLFRQASMVERREKAHKDLKAQVEVPKTRFTPRRRTYWQAMREMVTWIIKREYTTNEKTCCFAHHST